MIENNVIVFIGAPLSGKGTQGNRLAQILNYQYVSTGDLFRDEIKNESNLGKQMKIYMDRGDLIPNELTEEFLTKKLSENIFRNGMILDGYPRNLGHLTIFENILKNLHRGILVVIYLNVSKSELDQRRLTRNRNDDDEKIFEHRYEIFQNETLPLIELYRSKHLLIEIQSNQQSIDSIHREIFEQIQINYSK